MSRKAAPEEKPEVSADDAANDTTDKASDEAESVDDIKPSYQEPEIDNRVFDDYKNQTKVFSIDQPSGAKEKDYGSYFDDYEDVKPSAKTLIRSPLLPRTITIKMKRKAEKDLLSRLS